MTVRPILVVLPLFAAATTAQLSPDFPTPIVMDAGVASGWSASNGLAITYGL